MFWTEDYRKKKITDKLCYKSYVHLPGRSQTSSKILNLVKFQLSVVGNVLPAACNFSLVSCLWLVWFPNCSSAWRWGSATQLYVIFDDSNHQESLQQQCFKIINSQKESSCSVSVFFLELTLFQMVSSVFNEEEMPFSDYFGLKFSIRPFIYSVSKSIILQHGPFHQTALRVGEEWTHG